jgi:Transcriptional regulator, AbiEi antitoxin/Protein of unknown function (DUF559)
MHAKTHPVGPAGRREQRAVRERSLAKLAERQHGVVAKRQLAAHGLGRGAIANRVKLGHLHPVHRGVYAVGQRRLTRYGRWMAAVLAGGDRALLSYASAAALWGLVDSRRGPVDVTAPSGRGGRAGIALHRNEIPGDERATSAHIPVTSVPRTLVDLAGVLDEGGLRRAFEEADRLRLLDMGALVLSCERAKRRRRIRNLWALIEEARPPAYPRSALENRFLDFCRAHLGDLPPPATNVLILGHEVDAYWPRHLVVVELDGFAYHRHRAAFERDRARDAAMQAAGYRVIRLTYRRLEQEPAHVATELKGCWQTGAASRAASRRRSAPSRSGFRRPARPSPPALPSSPGRCRRTRR